MERKHLNTFSTRVMEQKEENETKHIQDFTTCDANSRQCYLTNNDLIKDQEFVKTCVKSAN